MVKGHWLKTGAVFPHAIRTALAGVKKKDAHGKYKSTPGHMVSDSLRFPVPREWQ